MRKLVIAAAMLIPCSVFAQGIRNTQHDLSYSSSGGTTGLHNTNAAQNQICIYCHTPHRAQSTSFLWNHTQTAATSWQWGNDLDGNPLSKTATGTALPTSLRSASKRCLGCHDGSVAIGDVSNAGNGATGVIPGLDSVLGLTSGGKLIDPTRLIGAPVTGTVGSMGGAHPISIPYANQTNYNGITSSVPAAWMGGAIGGYYDVTTAGCVSTTGVCTTAPAADGANGSAINLIPNIVGGTTNLGVECTTCHEPHNKFGFAYFLRVDVTNASGLCRSCHNK